jgi:hypothetical protein
MRLFAVAASETVRAALEKDSHLVEAALGHDRIVLSRDEAMRQILNVAAERVRELRTIQWANPVSEEGIVRWLEAGARMEPSRRLGALKHP